MGKGALGCGANTARVLLFAFNVIFWICGLVMLAVGIWLAVDPGAWDYIEVASDAGMDDPLLSRAIYVTIAVGVFIFLVGGAGCWGACQKSSCWLMVYAVLIGLTLVIQLVGAILAGVFRGKITDAVNEEMTKQVKEKYGTSYSSSLTQAWDAMQVDLKCCGSDNFTDYQDSSYTKNSTNSVLGSCCVFENGKPKDLAQCRADAAAVKEKSSALNTMGCYGELKDTIDHLAVIIIGVLVAIAVLEALGLLMACCLRRSITEESNRYT